MLIEFGVFANQMLMKQNIINANIDYLIGECTVSELDRKVDILHSTEYSMNGQEDDDKAEKSDPTGEKSAEFIQCAAEY